MMMIKKTNVDGEGNAVAGSYIVDSFDGIEVFNSDVSMAIESLFRLMDYIAQSNSAEQATDYISEEERRRFSTRINAIIEDFELIKAVSGSSNRKSKNSPTPNAFEIHNYAKIDNDFLSNIMYQCFTLITDLVATSDTDWDRGLNTVSKERFLSTLERIKVKIERIPVDTKINKEVI